MATKKVTKKRKSAVKEPEKSRVIAYLTVHQALGAIFTAGCTPGFPNDRQLAKVKARSGGSWSDAMAIVLTPAGELALEKAE